MEEEVMGEEVVEEEVKDDLFLNLQEKENKFIRMFAIIAIVSFVFSVYLFLVSSIFLKENPATEFQEQGTMLYSLNLDSFSINIADSMIVWIILILVIAITLIIASIIIYLKIKTIKKIRIEQQKNFNLNSEKIEIPEKVSYYNNKVLELLNEGNEFLNKKEYANARITYHKIRGWYNSHDDNTREIYLKILRFYEKVVSEEI